MILRAAHMDDRLDLAKLLNRKRLTGSAVELGTHLGEFAHQFLNVWNGRVLYCVDPWENLPEYAAQETLLWNSDGNREKDFSRAVERLAPHGKRVQLLRMTSEDASKRVQDESIDFVYVDANHEREYVLQDLNLWWPKIRPGGIIAGHDIICYEDSGGWGRHIQPALEEFTSRKDVPNIVSVICVRSLPWSYYIVKGE